MGKNLNFIIKMVCAFQLVSKYKFKIFEFENSFTNVQLTLPYSLLITWSARTSFDNTDLKKVEMSLTLRIKLENNNKIKLKGEEICTAG